MNAIAVVIDLSLAIVGLLVFAIARTKDTVSWWALLVYPAYWWGGLALGHLFLVMGLKPTLGSIDGATSAATIIYYLCCAFWGGLLVHLWNKLDSW